MSANETTRTEWELTDRQAERIQKHILRALNEYSGGFYSASTGQRAELLELTIEKSMHGFDWNRDATVCWRIREYRGGYSVIRSQQVFVGPRGGLTGFRPDRRKGRRRSAYEQLIPIDFEWELFVHARTSWEY